MEIISVEGIVISSISYKESSKIINILTPEYGIIGCISKGCKSMKSKLKLPSEKFAYGIFHLYYKKQGLSTLIDGDIKDYFINIKCDINKISYLTYIVELSTDVYKQSMDEEIYKMLISSINKIEEGLDPKVITNILELQYLNYLGINLNLDECVKCGNTKVCTLSISKGGYVCSNCVNNEHLIDPKVLKMLRLYNYVDISKISNLDIDDKVRDKIDEIIDEYYKEYSGVRTKSKSFLKEINENSKINKCS
ncbi:MAG: DNA repair protein RecO [Tenericutes bacterium]|nr:DNA repair protein RecO [Mycoplasmatota bacterium]